MRVPQRCSSQCRLVSVKLASCVWWVYGCLSAVLRSPSAGAGGSAGVTGGLADSSTASRPAAGQRQQHREHAGVLPEPLSEGRQETPGQSR